MRGGVGRRAPLDPTLSRLGNERNAERNRDTNPGSRSMKLFVCFGIATAFMLLAMPWPGLRAGRPLFRGLGI